VSTLEGVVRTAVEVADPVAIAQFAPCVVAAPDDGCYEEVATRFARVAWRRSLEPDERARLAQIGRDARAWASGDFDTGLAYELSAIFQSPSFVYLVELGDAPSGERPLSSHELATRLAFFLQHRTPDVELLDAADAGELTTPDDIRAAARRLLATPEARRAIDRFFSERFLIGDLSNVSKDPAVYPEWSADLARSMQEEMLRFLQDIVWSRDADARELFDSPDTFVDANLAAIYGVPAPAFGFEKRTLPPEQGRAGLLGKAGLMARLAHPVLTSPTRRGAFVWEHLLCDEVPAPPPGVITTLPPDEPGQHKTMRERLEKHFTQGEGCTGCHNKLDSVGLAFEHFDSIGRYRPDDQGLPIDAAGYFSGIGEFAGAYELGERLAESDDAVSCLVRSFHRQAIGHLETEGDIAAIDATIAEFAASGFSVQSMLVELVASPAFTRVSEPK
jgi:hypothetical protein